MGCSSARKPTRFSSRYAIQKTPVTLAHAGQRHREEADRGTAANLPSMYKPNIERAGTSLFAWVNGSQQFDAEVVEAGAYVQQNCLAASGYLEATCVMHPTTTSIESYSTRRANVRARRYSSSQDREIESKPVIRRNLEFVHSYSKLVLKANREEGGYQVSSRHDAHRSVFSEHLYTPKSGQY